MTLPVLVVPREGQYSAVLAGAPDIRAVGATRDEAITALRTEIAQRLGRGELYWLELDTIESLAPAHPVSEVEEQRANLERLRHEVAGLPVRNPADGFSNRMHDYQLYGGGP